MGSGNHAQLPDPSAFPRSHLIIRTHAMNRIEWNPEESIRRLQSFGSSLHDQIRGTARVREEVDKDNHVVFARRGYVSPLGKEIRFPGKECSGHSCSIDLPDRVTSSPRLSSPTLLSVRKSNVADAANALQKLGCRPVILYPGNMCCSTGTWLPDDEQLYLVSTLGQTLAPLTSRRVSVHDNSTYSQVIVFRYGEEKGYAFREEPFEAAVITAAPLDFRSDQYYDRIYQADSLGTFTREGQAIMEEKVRTILRIALSYGHDCLVTGAWGYFSHGQNPEIITRLFGQILEEEEFKDKLREVVFAIPSREPYETIRRIVCSTCWTPPSVPARNCYQIGEDRIWAGEYPGDRDGKTAIAKLKTALEFGITHFIDLTEDGELEPYSYLLPSKVSHLRFPIRDVSAPKSIQETYSLMQNIEEIMRDSGNRIYLHCHGGVGRTGTIAACWIAYSRHTDLATTMRELQSHWKQCPKSYYRHIPDHISQLEFVESFIFSTLKMQV